MASENGDRKGVRFVGRSLDELRDFPREAMQQAGHYIDLVQQGETPSGSKPMKTVGSGCWELVVDVDDGWFRVFYVATFGSSVWILHCFQKKTNQTPKKAIDLGKSRYKAAVEEHKVEEDEKGR